MGAAFYTGAWKDVPATFVIYDSQTECVEAYQVKNGGTNEFEFSGE
jgi:hypothetical protein